jgi:hypothetical protein
VSGGGAGDGASKRRKKKATCVVEPFTLMTLSVAAGTSVSHCVAAALTQEQVSQDVGDSDDEDEDGERASGTPCFVREQRLGAAPRRALVVQLGRWAVTSEGEAVKLGNVVALDRVLQLPIDASAVTTDARKPSSAKYRIKAAVCHRGTHPGRGHYVTYIFGDGSESWLTNDASVTTIPSDTALQTASNDTPYLVLYLPVDK